MNKIVTGLLAATLASLTSMAAAQPVKLKFASFSPDTERLFTTVMKPFVAGVNKDSGGTVEIEIYPNGALGRAPQQQAQMVLDGVADIGFVVPGFTPGRFPDSEVLELPGMFRDLKEGTIVYTRMVASGAIKDFNAEYVPIAMWATPPFSLHTNYPVNSISDLKGRKIRGSGVFQIESLKALGVTTVGMAPTEVPEAISRRTIDGSTSQPAVVYDFGLDRVTNHHYFIKLGVVPLVVVMNKKKFDSLPKAGQDAIRKYGLEWNEKMYTQSMLAYDAELVKRMESDPKRKVVHPGPADTEAARKAFEPVTAAWVNKSPRHAELYKQMQAEIEKVRAGK
ncbi:MAG: TRAP-type C4-dicarboxylate transport system, substrate-binding protein [Ramlibacter sp.]|jgi:TRAP-type C4-dicarboxylate transport system substrate-binding protein|nr:TRAP-type C4-dicarboxylate transport system, substrate-binding protein [Ramlibacter sp.]MDB5912234.1 TRAP-type C4-dicarboxylate transport system, substrate-binding protein [Ramlibacter sp.]